VVEVTAGAGDSDEQPATNTVNGREKDQKLSLTTGEVCMRFVA
jgi:hypothetical protein